MSKQNRSYANEFKREAIALAMDSPSVVSAAKSLGIPEATLHTWVNKARSSGDQTITAKGCIQLLTTGRQLMLN